MTKSEAIKTIKGLGLSVSYIAETGEYRIREKGGSETTAYYTDDADDAVATARAMIEESKR